MNLNELTELLEEIADEAAEAASQLEWGSASRHRRAIERRQAAMEKAQKEFEEMSARISALEKAGQDLYVCVEFEADPLLKDVAMQNWKKVRE